MKPQDLLFFVILAALFVLRNPRSFIWAGLVSLAAAYPLFSFWIFFTAQRLTWYAFVFFLAAALLVSVSRKEGAT